MISNIDNPKYSFFVRELGDRYIHELSDGRLDMIKTILPFRSCLLKTRNVWQNWKGKQFFLEHKNKQITT